MGIYNSFNRNFGKWFINDTLRAIKRYAMITPGQNIAVALSGGKDSMTLLYILWYINRYSHLHFSLSAAHVKTSDYDTAIMRQYCDELSVPYYETSLVHPAPSSEKVCSICSRLKRGALNTLLGSLNIPTVAFGHHADDVAETFLMNIINNRKLGTFSPVVSTDDSYLRIIRPLVYIDDKTIMNIHSYANLPKLVFDCPYAKYNIRTDFRAFLEMAGSYFKDRDISKSIVGALENIDSTNIWKQSSAKNSL